MHRLTPAAAGLFALALSGVLHAQQYPTKPIRVVVPFAAGGPSDITIRNIAPKMTELLGVPIVVDTRGGANGFIGAEIAAKSAPDGYTLLSATASITSINMVVYHKRPYETLRDFQPLTTIMATDTILVINPSVPAHDMKELVSLAKTRPGRLAFASAGTGGTLHLALELLNTQAGTQITHVPYKGAGPAVIDVIAGQVNGMFVDLPVISPYIKSGKVRAIAVCSPKRSVYFPDVPTTAEGGYPGVEMSNQYSILAPAKTPRAIVMKLHDAVAKTMATPEVREKFASFGADPLIMSPEEFTDFIRKDIDKWAKVAKAANIKVDE
ncbi:MAG TPA: tripartite tricarboxylate transporter substrate binding protein [Burkholderiales bacterium]|nr:tripartite tricarboxylate transporter substrate binding protein [Burkholderiales bacterium]